MNARRWVPGALAGMVGALLAASLPAEEAAPLEKLKTQLSSSDVTTRREAIYQISKLGPAAKDALPAIIAALADSDKQVWSVAMGLIADLGPAAADAVPALIAGLDPRQRAGPRYRRGGEVPFRSAYALSRIGTPAIAPLIAMLKNDDSSARAAAARGLGGMGPLAKDAVLPLIENLRRDQPIERRETIEALGAIGPEAVAPLTAALPSPDALTRAGAVLALAQLGSAAKPAAGKLRDIAKTEQDPGVRSALFAAVTKVGVAPAESVPLLIAGVKDDNAAVRHEATNAIYTYRAAQPQLVAALTVLLRDANQPTSDRAAAVLGRLGPVAAPAVDALLELARKRTGSSAVYLETLGRIGADAVPGILRAVEKENPDAITREHWSVRCVPIIGGEAIPALAAALVHQNVSVRLLAARGLGELGAVAAPSFDALKNATSDNDPRVRAAALVALVGTKTHGVEAMSKVEAGLKDASPAMRLAAASLVPSLGERARNLAPTLLATLGDADAKVRASVIDSLSAVGGAAEPAVPRLLEILPKSEPATRVKILAVFAGIGPNAGSVLPVVRQQVADADPAVRAAALHAVAKIDDPTARLPLMLAALNDSDVRVRRAAAEEVAVLGDKARDATAALTAMLQHDDERDVAFDAIRKVGVRSVPHLITMLSDHDITVKVYACNRLGRMGSEAKEAAAALKDVTTRAGERDEVRRSARDALSKVQTGS